MAETRTIWLAVDTAGAAGGVALAAQSDGAEPAVLGFLELAGRTFSARLLPAVGEVLAGAGLTLRDVDRFAVVTGPGSFTGLRVGISAVKGLAEVTGKPVVGVSRLALMCSGADGEQASVLDAGRGEFYCGRYRDSGMECEREALCSRDELRGWVGTDSLLVCEDAVAGALGEFKVERVAAPTAVDALRLAARYWSAGRRTEVGMLDANYLRRSDAELFARVKPVGAGR